jgi:hypothetical protein
MKGPLRCPYGACEGSLNRGRCDWAVEPVLPASVEGGLTALVSWPFPSSSPAHVPMKDRPGPAPRNTFWFPSPWRSDGPSWGRGGGLFAVRKFCRAIERAAGATLPPCPRPHRKAPASYPRLAACRRPSPQSSSRAELSVASRKKRDRGDRPLSVDAIHPELW